MLPASRPLKRGVEAADATEALCHARSAKLAWQHERVTDPSGFVRRARGLAALRMTFDSHLPPSELPAILLVDDRQANLVALEALLSGLPCRFVRASSGREALELLLEEPYAVMLLDVQMPLMDGFEVARLARSSSVARDVPIVFLTAAASSEEFESEGYGTGAVDFLFKPLDRQILRSKVSVFLQMFESRQRLYNANALLERKNQKLLSLAQEEAGMIEHLRSAHAELQRAQSELRSLGAPLDDLTAMLDALGARLSGDTRDDVHTLLRDAKSRLAELRALVRASTDASQATPVRG